MMILKDVTLELRTHLCRKYTYCQK